MRTLVVALLVLAGTASAAPSTLAPGTYVTERGWGTLEIKPAQKDGQRFELNAMGGNGHSCGLEGVIRQGKATIEDGDQPACVVRFEKKDDGLDVTTPDASACRGWCGARAWFEGSYRQPPAQCRASAVKKTRAAFKKLYDRKAYAEARDTLRPLLDTCRELLGTFDEHWIRNDLAVTLHHLNDDAACLQTLEPVRSYAEADDDELGAGEPAYRESYLRLARATRANLKLCTKKPVSP